MLSVCSQTDKEHEKLNEFDGLVEAMSQRLKNEERPDAGVMRAIDGALVAASAVSFTKLMDFYPLAERDTRVKVRLLAHDISQKVLMWINERDTTDKHGLAVQNADLVSVKRGRGGPKFYIDFSADGLDKIRLYVVGLCVTTDCSVMAHPCRACAC